MTSIKPKNESALTVERIRDLLDYDSVTGIFRWRVSRGGKALAGSIAGEVKETGYRKIMINQRHYFAHRLAWLYVHGEWPTGDLDHRDTEPDHNWIDNLRPATETQNLGNMRRPSRNTSGFKGVSYVHRLRKWRAQIQTGYDKFHLGVFPTAEEAHAAYMAKAKELFGAFANKGG